MQFIPVSGSQFLSILAGERLTRRLPNSIKEAERLPSGMRFRPSAEVSLKNTASDCKEFLRRKSEEDRPFVRGRVLRMVLSELFRQFFYLRHKELEMYRFAVYGKGGIGKSTACTALSSAFAEMGMKVMQVGCDPKADSTLYLHGGERIPTMLDTLRAKRDAATLDDLICTGYRGIVCAEAGGPTPGLGCAGRGIAAAFEALDERDVFEIVKPDLVQYDVLGDVVCGGFAMPIREGYADRVFIVTSGENMSIYAAANIAMAVENFRRRGYAALGGLILNRRNVPDELSKVQTLAAELHTEILADLPRDDHISDAQDTGRGVMEVYPDCAYAQGIRALAGRMLEVGEDR